MLKNLVLIGFMGTGKSTIGRQLSKTLGYPVIDTDTQIESNEDRPIADIFANEGEPHFRQLETQILQQLLTNNTHKHIISTGGGIITRPENLPLLRDLGFVIWLVAKPETILERTSRNKDRPLLNNKNPEDTVRNLLQQREPLYAQAAHLSLETTGLTFSEITTGIIESARYHYGNG
ncbi:MAG: shikimate kinase [Verrucomicrobiota bacterium]